jgi:hypothetical protein
MRGNIHCKFKLALMGRWPGLGQSAPVGLTALAHLDDLRWLALSGLQTSGACSQQGGSFAAALHSDACHFDGVSDVYCLLACRQPLLLAAHANTSSPVPKSSRLPGSGVAEPGSAATTKAGSAGIFAVSVTSSVV